jgi:UDP-N-acetylmuramate dehydrogenase
MEKQIQQLEEKLGQKIQRDIPLAKYTSFKIGGPAKYFFLAKNNDDLVKAVAWSKKLKIPSYILSGCSNVLVADIGFNGLVILNQAQDIIFSAKHGSASGGKSNNQVVADAGVNLMDLVNKSIENGLSGLEWAAGIPGSVGGAIRGNAGAFRGEIADNITKVEVMRGAKQFVLDKSQCEFKYRDSIFKHNNDLIISAEFELSKGDKTKSQQQVNEILQNRKTKQPLEFPSAGCVFKNILITSANKDEVAKLNNLPQEYLKYKKIPAAWLIDSLDLKGKTIGKAQVSDKHANFMINLGGATANEVLQLISYVKMSVRDNLGFQLMEEIEYVGF